jgi:hypothetical protein
MKELRIDYETMSKLFKIVQLTLFFH